MKDSVVLIVITSLLTALLTVGGLIGCLWYAVNNGYLTTNNLSVDNIESLYDVEPEDTSVASVYIPLSKVVMTVRGESIDHIVLVEISVETRQPEYFENIDGYMPLIKNKLLKLFSDKSHNDLVGNNAIKVIELEVSELLVKLLANQKIHNAVDNVIVTKFIVQ